MEGNINRRKKNRFTIFDLIAVIVIIGILVAVLVPSFRKYSIESKKVEAKSIVREFIIAVETAGISDNIEFSDSDYIGDLVKSRSDILNEYINEDFDLSKVENITLKEAKEIVLNQADFNVDKFGKIIGLSE